MQNGLDLSEGELRRLAGEALQMMLEHYRGLRERPIMPRTSSRALREVFGEALPREGAEPAELLRIVREQVFPQSRQNGHPRFFGYIASPGCGLAAIGDLLAGALNSNVTAWRSAPAPTELEHAVVGWLKEMLGYPAEAAGLFVSGGSMANLAGLAAARNAKAPGDARRQGLSARLRVYASAEAHFSIQKAAGLLGIGEENVVSIATDVRFRMDLAELERRVVEDREAGFLPAAVVACAGTVATGSIDPLPEVAEIARRHGLWMHVDACYGGFAALADSVRPKLAGIEQADSVALDPHKWLYSSTGCGCVLYRDPAAARAAFAHGADYINVVGFQADEAFAFWDYGPELSRRFRALGIWLLIKAVGARGLGEAVQKNIDCARRLACLVEASGDFEMMAPVELSVFCFRYRPEGFTGDLDALNERLLVELQRDGSSYLSNARLNGRFALRGCVVNYRTTEEDMQVLLEDARRAGRREFTSGAARKTRR